MSQPNTDVEPRSFVQRHLYPNRYILILTLVFIGLGIVYAHTYFPKMSTLQATFGGIVIGLFGTMFAACHTKIWQD